MRMKDYDERDGKRVWLSEKEIQTLLTNTDSDRPDIDAALLLASRCGLRRNEIVQVTPGDLERTDHGQVVRIWGGKGEKYREVPVPDELMHIALGINRDQSESLVTCDPSTIYDYVARARARSRAQTHDEGWKFVGPHDLRRSWGVRLLEAGVLPSVVMEWGGWEDWETFRNHYLAEFSPEALRRERGKVSWLGGRPEDHEHQGFAAVETRSTTSY